jgi:hypothetical protein
LVSLLLRFSVELLELNFLAGSFLAEALSLLALTIFLAAELATLEDEIVGLLTTLLAGPAFLVTFLLALAGAFSAIFLTTFLAILTVVLVAGFLTTFFATFFTAGFEAALVGALFFFTVSFLAFAGFDFDFFVTVKILVKPHQIR